MASLQTKWFCCCIALLLLTFSAYTQVNISGRVVEDSSDIPLDGASVYFNKTTIGTYTDQQGDFQLEMTDLLNTEMVVSCNGYELLVYQVVPTRVKGKRIIFKLHAKEKSPASEISLSGQVRKRCMEIFQATFLGVTKEASKCTINNGQIISFTTGADNTLLMLASADTPIVVINNMLGYKISFNLIEFWYNDATGESYINGFTRYEDLDIDKKSSKNRLDCYYGSTLHFYRSLIRNQLYEEGYGTFAIREMIDSARRSMLTPEQAKAASEIVTTEPLNAHQILFIDSTNDFFIRATGRLLVQYYKDPAGRRFLEKNHLLDQGLSKGVESNITFKVASIGLNNAGVLSEPDKVEYSGYWSFEKAANSLPYDYKPGG